MIRHLSLLIATTVALLASVEGGQIDDLYEIPDSSTSTTAVNFDTVAYLDLDQRIIMARLASESEDNMAAAKNVFEKGTYSDSYAMLNIIDDVNDSFSSLEIPPGTVVDGQTSSGFMIQGKVFSGSSNGQTTLDVHYIEKDLYGSTPSLNVCRVGGNPTPIITGCFAPTGTINFEIQGSSNLYSFDYSYDPLQNNYNGLTLSNLDQFRGQSRPQTTMNKYIAYYGSEYYDKEWIRAAFDNVPFSTEFDDRVFDFTKFGLEGRGVAIHWGIVVLRMWMFVVNGFEDAVAKCIEGSTQTSIERWDQAVAAYSGSEPISTGDGSGGYFLYTLAQTECINFGTCTKDAGIAPINQKLYLNFNQGQKNLQRNDCLNAQKNAKRIVQLMTIPLIQGVLRTSHAFDVQDNSQDTIQAQATASAAAILPLVYDCNVGNAFTIYDDLAPGKATASSFYVLKDTLERVYECLGVTCEEVGGLKNLQGNGYLPDAGPCGVSADQPPAGFVPQPQSQPTKQPTAPYVPPPASTSTSSGSSSTSNGNSYKKRPNKSNALAIGLGVGGFVIALLIALIVGCVDHKNAKQFDTAQGMTDDGPSPGESATGDEVPTDAEVEAEIAAGENAQIV